MSPDDPPLPLPPPEILAAAGLTHHWRASVAWNHLPERTTWRLQSPTGEVRYLKVYALDPDSSLAAERDRLRWAVSHLPVPHVLDHGVTGTSEWLLTQGLDGASAVDDTLRAQPDRLVPLLAESLRLFHATPTAGCPFQFRLDTVLPALRHRLETGRVDPDWVFTAHGNRTTREAVDYLERERPPTEDLVLCHGDYCVPNVLVKDWRLAGFVDLGALGVADRWYDLAIALWSITRNLGPGWEDHFLHAYGIPRDPHRIAYYHLLYDLH